MSLELVLKILPRMTEIESIKNSQFLTKLCRMNTLTSSLVLLLLVGYISAQTYSQPSVHWFNSQGSHSYVGSTGSYYMQQGSYMVNSATSSYLVMQWDGNLCIYTGSYPGSSNSVYVWCDGNLGTGICSNNAYGSPQNYVTLQTDGNFCKYCGQNPSHKGAFLWCTGIIPEYFTITGYVMLPGGNTSISDSSGGLMIDELCYYSYIQGYSTCGLCGSGLISCSSWGHGTFGDCINDNNDPLNCGSCGHACGAGDGGHGAICCNGDCYNVDGADNDPAYCGVCTTICDIDSYCDLVDGGWMCVYL